MNKHVKTVVAGLVLLIIGVVAVRPDRNLHLIVCDVGQGDAILAVWGKTQVLIDGGPNDKVLECLSDNIPFWDRTVELMMLTNTDADHMTGLIEVLGRYRVGQLVANNLAGKTERFKAFRRAVIDSGTQVFGPRAGDSLRIRGGGREAELQVIWPGERLGDARVWLADADERVLGANTYSRKANEQSVAAVLKFGEFDVLLSGDIGFETERELVERGLVTDVEVLKVGHHGSKYSSGAEFLEAARPEAAIISSGKNRYGHPTAEAIERLKAAGARVWRTDEDGEIEVVTDGKKWWKE